MSNESKTLVDLMAAIVANEAMAVRLVRATPEIALARVAAERLVEEVPHQLYLGDTPLHLAAAALRPLVVAALIEAGADSNVENRRGAPLCTTRAMHGPRRERSGTHQTRDR